MNAYYFFGFVAIIGLIVILAVLIHGEKTKKKIQS